MKPTPVKQPSVYYISVSMSWYGENIHRKGIDQLFIRKKQKKRPLESGNEASKLERSIMGYHPIRPRIRYIALIIQSPPQTGLPTNGFIIILSRCTFQ